ncbi:MAG: endonuclease/exonuclease/phosphatase family protein [Deltaproteobacteria bacterium]|nr:endonuclease/exonuclease/phosphatase family protein [Deltaproteobacteria bacterium]
MSTARPAAFKRHPLQVALLCTALLAAGAGCPGPGAESVDAGCRAPCGEACCPSGTSCDEASGACVECTALCEGRQCGDDGCGDECGPCDEPMVCTSQGRCVESLDAGTGSDGGPSAADAGPVGPPVTFKVMDWNVHDFFDETDDPAKQDTQRTATQVNSKIAKLADAINDQQPDILALQEVETKDLLRRLNDSLTKKLPNFELVPAGDPRGINVALMTRFPITQVTSHWLDQLWGPDGNKYFYSRDCLEVHLDVGGNRALAVLVNHLVSQLEDTNDAKRRAQAQGARDVGDAVRRDKPWVGVLIAGDMNDDPTSSTLQVFFNGGAWVDFWSGSSTSQAWTFKEGSRSYRLDYLIPDSTTATWKQSASLVHSAHVTAGSDHAPVVATFVYP